jgi:hypothetical protein
LSPAPRTIISTAINFLLAGILAVFCGSAGHAQIIYSNAFNGGAVNIAGTPPNFATNLLGGTSTATWIDAGGAGDTNAFYADGNVGTAQGDSILLPFQPQPNQVYTLTASVTFTGNPGNWVGAGFAEYYATPGIGNARFADSGVNGYDFAILTEGNGNVQWFTGPRGTGQIFNQNGFFTAGAGTHTVKLMLDTTGSQWVIACYIDGVQAGANDTYASPPIGALGITQTTQTAPADYYWNSLTLSVAPLQITQQPVSATVNAGTAYTNTVVVAGAPPFFYQWFTNNVPIGGATNAALTFNPVTIANAGTNYYVVITNNYGAVTSTVASLVVVTNTINTVTMQRGSLALTPPMGWNDWYTYRCTIDESIVESTADTIVANGMEAAGYQFVNLDDCWAASRNLDGVIAPNPSQFPDGMTVLAGYVHSDGLKFGVYTAHGTLTCQDKPGSYDYEYLDAFTYAGWNVDFLKDDACTLPAGDNAESDYFRMSNGLLKSGRPIVFSLCEAANGYESWSPTLGNSWRTTGDTTSTFTNVVSHIDPNSLSAYVAGPGRWNDVDILQIGMGDFTNLIPAQTQFSMWCIMASPLLAGNNLTTMSAQTLSVLTNAEAIAVDQDPAGEQATWAGGIQDAAEAWSKPLGYDFTTRAVALLNRSTTSSANITCVWTNLGFQPGTATVRDLWAHANLGTFTNSFTTNVPAEGAVFLKVVGTPVPPPVAGINYLSNLQPIYAYVSSNGVWVTPAENKNLAGQTMKLNGQAYSEGVGVTTTSGLEYNLGGCALRFQSDLGVDDQEGGNGSVIFQVFADGTKIYDSGIMTGGMTKQSLNLDVTGVRRLTLGVCDTINDTTGNRSTVSTANYADWANALVIATNVAQMPETPTGLAAIRGNAITLDWNPTLAAITYNVKRATVSGGPYTTITNVPLTTFTDSNVVNGTAYYYVVSAVSSLGEGSNSLEASATPGNILLAPTNVLAIGSNSQITVTWNSSVGATSYNVYRFTTTTPPALIGTGIPTTNFTDAPLGAAVTNFYLITAANASYQSGWSAYAAGITTPGAPTGLVALPENSEISLGWIAPPGSTAFNVQRSTTNGGPYQTIASSISETAYFDSAVTAGKTYFYVVSALNAGGNGPNSAQVSATPFTTNSLLFAQPLPSPVTVVSGQSYIYSIGVAGQTPYFYQWYNAGARISKATNAAYTATAAGPGSTTYFVVVTNFSGAITSTVSTFISISPPTAPTNSYATNLLGLKPAAYWPMHEVEGAAPGDVEINYGSLGLLGTAFYPDWVTTNGSFTRQVAGALSGDADTALHFNYNVGNLGNGAGTWTNEIYIPHTSPWSTLNPPFSVECWLYDTNASVGQLNQSVWGQHGWEGLNAGYAGSGSGANISGMQLAYNRTGAFTLYGYFNGVQTPIASYVAAGINSWYHVVVTCDASTNFTLYVNGTPAATAAGAGLFTPDYWTPLTIGGTRGGTRSAIITVDEFAVYTNVISDIPIHYYDGLAGVSGQYFSDVLNDKPVIYLRMDAPAYSPPPLNTWPILFNYGSAGANGLYTPGTAPSVLPGPITTNGIFSYRLSSNSVPQFGGISSFADAGYATAFNPAGSNANFAVTAMFRGNPCDNRIQSIVGHGTNSWQLSVTTNGCVVFNAGNGNRAAGGTGQASGDLTTKGVYNDGNWHQVVAVNQTNVISIYVDGALDTNGTPAGIAPTNLITGNSSDVMIGSDPNYTNNPAGVGRSFAGQICEVAFFTNALTAGQVQAIYLSAITFLPETLTYLNMGRGQVQLNWSYGTLQSATNVAGPYQDLMNTSPPYVAPITNAQEFYRLREN